MIIHKKKSIIKQNRCWLCNKLINQKSFACLTCNKKYSLSIEFKEKFRDKHQDKFKLSGYKFMQAMERWAKKHKEKRIIHIPTDDHNFSSSDIWLIPGPQKNYITMLCIPQNGDAPCEMIIYNHTKNDLIKSLSKFNIKD